MGKAVYQLLWLSLTKNDKQSTSAYAGTNNHFEVLETSVLYYWTSNELDTVAFLDLEFCAILLSMMM